MIHSAVWLDTKDAAQTTLKSLNVVDSSPSVIIFMGGILTRLSLNGRSMAFGFATLNAIKCHKHIKHTIYTPCLFALNATPSTENEEPTPKANMSSSRTWNCQSNVWMLGRMPRDSISHYISQNKMTVGARKAVVEVSKDRKPSRKVCCCDAWTSEQTDGPKGGWGSGSLSSLSLPLPPALSLYLSLSLSACLSLSLYISMYLSLYESICPSFLPSIFLYLPKYLSI